MFLRVVSGKSTKLYTQMEENNNSTDEIPHSVLRYITDNMV